MKTMIKTMLHGFSMALADSVPGVSGGTIAFIMGFYEQFLNALHRIMGKDRALRKEAFLYLIKFAVGWGLGMGSSILFLSRIFEKNIYFMSSLFLGLTACAIPFIIYEERKTLKRKYQNLLFTVFGAALVVLLTAFRTNADGSGGIDFQHLSIPGYGYLILSGMFAISTMLLPGISGSTLLLILGVYIPLIHAAKEILCLHMQYLPGFLAIVAGALMGIVFASKFIRKALRKFRPQMIYLILGLMAGSLYAIIMGPTTLDMPQPPLDFSSFSVVAFLIGVFIIGAMEFWKLRSVHKEKNGERQADNDS